MSGHRFHCYPQDFAPFHDGTKWFAIILAKKAGSIMVGDMVTIEEAIPNHYEAGSKPRATGRCVVRRVTHVAQKHPGVEPGFTAISFSPIQARQRRRT